MTRAALALLLGAVAALVTAVQPMGDTDMWWHLATGRETIAHGLVRSDVFSWTVRGTPVTTDQWLGQVAMYLSYIAAGWRGVALLRVALMLALIGLTAWNASVRAPRPLATVLATVPALLLTRAIAVDRPELAGFVCFAALLVLLRAAQAGDSRALVGLVVLIGVWTNVHGSFALGAVLVAIVCVDGALRERSRARAWLACAVASVAVTLLNPALFGVWSAPESHLLSPPRAIQEWNVVDVRTALGAAFVATLMLVVACVFLGPRVTRTEIVLLVPITLISMTAARQAPLLAIAAAPLFAGRADLLLARLDNAPSSLAASRIAFAGAGALLLAAVALAPAAPDTHAYPLGALTSIPIGDGVLARYEWGGWLIWSGMPVFVDGRLTPYRGGVLDDYTRILTAAPGWRDAIARRGVRTLLVEPSDPVATRAIELGWTVQRRDPDAVVIAVP